MWQIIRSRYVRPGLQMIRYRLFEIWRFMAALLIMLYHFGHFAPSDALWVKDGLELLRPLLDLFFIISGFLIFDRYGERVLEARAYGAYLFKRLVRLYPLHLVTLSYFVAVGLAVELGLSNTGGGLDLFQWETLLTNLLLMQGWGLNDNLTFNYVSWSLSGEWLAYLLLPILALAWRIAGLAGLALMTIASYGGLEFLVASGLMPETHWVYADTWGAYRVFADFALGALLAMLARKWPLHSSGSRLAAWIALLVSCMLMTLDISVYVSIAVLALAVYLAALAELVEPERYTYPAFLRPAAAVSFGVYLWHPVTESIFFSYIWNKYLLGAPAGVFFVYVAAVMVITVGVAILSFVLFENRIADRLLVWSGLHKPKGAVSPGL
ncbi:acyltransferase family protein [Nitratireductor sp. CH_MIT9313-5]|uniref:acyltransferase family protein n=1 Tax=Nitratireductor sp. CH_MIT9313-5 TaxID=3107764 RepID=UPI003008B843